VLAADAARAVVDEVAPTVPTGPPLAKASRRRQRAGRSAEAAADDTKSGAAATPALQAPADENQIVWGDVDLLDAHPNNPRIGYPEETFEALVTRMAAEGRADPSHPLVGRWVAERIEVLSGHTRLRAAKKASVRQMPVILRVMSDAEALVYLATANLQEPLTALEHGLASIEAEQHGVNVKSYADSCGLQPSNLSRYRQGARVFLEIRTAIGEDNVIRLRDRAEHLAAISRAPADEWADLVRRCVTEAWSVSETKEHVTAPAEPVERLTLVDPEPSSNEDVACVVVGREAANDGPKSAAEEKLAPVAKTDGEDLGDNAAGPDDYLEEDPDDEGDHEAGPAETQMTKGEAAATTRRARPRPMAATTPTRRRTSTTSTTRRVASTTRRMATTTTRTRAIAATMSMSRAAPRSGRTTRRSRLSRIR
jgi:ParB-like chromosome segregation protein Spo0J